MIEVKCQMDEGQKNGFDMVYGANYNTCWGYTYAVFHLDKVLETMFLSKAMHSMIKVEDRKV